MKEVLKILKENINSYKEKKELYFVLDILKKSMTNLKEKEDALDEFIYRIPKIVLPIKINKIRQVVLDSVFLHPVYGLFIIEVKRNFNNIRSYEMTINQVKMYKLLVSSFINNSITVDYRIVYPYLSKKNLQKHSIKHEKTFFKEDLEKNDFYKKFLYPQTTEIKIPTKSEYLKIVKYFIPNIEEIIQIEKKEIPKFYITNKRYES